MEIFVAHSTLVEPDGSWVLRQLTDYTKQGVEPKLDLGGVGDPISDDLLAHSDAFVAEFAQPNDELARKVKFARALGKSVLALMPISSDPTKYLPDFPGHEYREADGRYAYNYYLDELPSGTALAIYRGTRPRLKLKIWTQAQLRRQRLAFASDKMRSELVEDMLAVDPEADS